MELSTSVMAGFFIKNIDKIMPIIRKTYSSVDENLKYSLGLIYDTYLYGVYDKYSRSKSFFIRSQSVDMYDYYVPISISCGHTSINEPSIDNVLKYSRYLVITGTGGCGKSVLMRHLLLDCIRSCQYVPVMIELRDVNEGVASLDGLIAEAFGKFGFDIKPEFIEKAKKSGQFLFLLDGYDEVNHSDRKKLIKDIKRLINRCPLCPLILSTRPDEIFHGIDEFDIFFVDPLSLGSAALLVDKLPYDIEIKKKFKEALIKELFEKHESFLSNPLLLTIMLMTYSENADIPTKLSVFYQQSYEVLFQKHDANKGGYLRDRYTNLDIQDFARVFSLFSLLAYDKRLFRMSRISCLTFIEKSAGAINNHFSFDGYLSDLLESTCLLVEDGLDLSYTHRSFQEYFVACYIASAVPEVQKRLIEKYAVNVESDNVISLLYEMNPDLVERYYLIPKYSRLFEFLGVVKKIGKRHLLRYLKLYYDKIGIMEDEGEYSICAFPNSSDDDDKIMVVRFSYNVIIRDEIVVVWDLKSVYEKYLGNHPGDTVDVEFWLSKINTRSPFFVELCNSGDWLSLKYLQNIYDLFLRLKRKHENPSRNLENLLGW